MFITTWRFVILTGSAFSGHRVKRIINSGTAPTIITPAPSFEMSTSFPGPLIKHSAAPTFTQINTVTNKQDPYVFAFWSFTGFGNNSGIPISGISFTNDLNGVSFNLGGDDYIINATAWYIFDFRNGPGDNGVYLDAFDISIGDFIADDFVDVAPDLDGSLTASANNGEIDTSTKIAQGASQITITARQNLPGTRNEPNKIFAYWQENPLFTYHDPTNVSPPSVNGAEIKVGYNEIVVANAFYLDDPNWKFTPIPILRYAPILGWVRSDAGWIRGPIGSPPDTGPGPGPLEELFFASKLLEYAKSVSGETRSELLKSAERLALAAAKGIKRGAQGEK
jgi:hypothetical protein